MVKRYLNSNPMARDLIIIIVLLALCPFFSTDYYVTVLCSSIIFAIFAVSLDIAWGYGGILSLGHSAFFGLGAYVFSITALRGDSIINIILGIALGIIIPTILALIVSGFIFYIKSSPFYIGVVTLALAVIFEQLSLRLNDLTGGQNGLTNVPSFPFLGLKLYFFLLIVLVGVIYFAYRLITSDIGKLFISVRDSEERSQFLGYNTPIIRTLIFCLSGSIAGLAGVLYAPFDGFVSPSLLSFTLATQVVVWVAIGGRGKLVGAIIGSLLINILSPIFNSSFPFIWQMFLGTIFVLVVVIVPDGLYSFLNRENPLRKRNFQLAPLENEKVIIHEKHEEVVVIQNMEVSFGELTILKGLNLTLHSGEIQCIVGPNGAGKSTLINAITGKCKVSDGNVYLDKQRINGWKPQQIAKSKMARTFQSTSIIGSLTVAENLQLSVRKGNLPSLFKRSDNIVLPSLTLQLVHQTGLNEKLGERAENLSHGDQQSLELCMVMALQPKVLLLDEPTAGLTSFERKVIGNLFKKLSHEQGISLLIIEHDIDFVKEIADRVTVLYDGKIAIDGSVSEVTNSSLVKEIYIGHPAVTGGEML